MRWSQMFIPTLREAPAEAEVASHILLLRGGYIRQLASGIYSFLPLAQRVMNKIAKIIREELDRMGAQEFLLPALHPAELWQESGRWDLMGQNMFRLQDRSDRDLCLGMTHEEVFTAIVRNEVRSYRQLPQVWYQIQTKFRDEPRPKSGLLRVRQFSMKDSYSFDVSWEGLDVSYQKHYQLYRRIYDRCGLKYHVVEADSGMMGGRQSQEFMVVTDAGEDLIAYCGCGYAANLEKARSRLENIVDEAGPARPQLVHTPNQKTIDEISAFLKIPPTHQIKTMIYMCEQKPFLALLRGDHQLNEIKLRAALGSEVRPAHPDEIRNVMGAAAGSLGPVGTSGIRILSDLALANRKNLTCGANRDDYHLTGVTPGRDYQAEFMDLRIVQQGEACIECGSPLAVNKALEIGHIFKLGTKYSESMGATVLNAEGKEVPIVMGSYGIGLERIMAAAIELYHDVDGIQWPLSIAPFQCLICLLNTKDSALVHGAEQAYQELQAMNVEVLLDDRDERPGVKFKDADLIGIPVRINFGSKKYAAGIVEWVDRSTRKVEDLPLTELSRKARSILETAGAS
ncbi:MAG TPA: proline--tRNA ligase [Desulfomonilaceae bacterium]|nr:proline--tRNA ligase [Desulfomonilaceae bacterium]